MVANGKTGRRLATETSHPSSLAKQAVRRQPPKVGAVCGNPACTDLCGGRPVMDVPTANPNLPLYGTQATLISWLSPPSGGLKSSAAHSKRNVWVLACPPRCRDKCLSWPMWSGWTPTKVMLKPSRMWGTGSNRLLIQTTSPEKSLTSAPSQDAATATQGHSVLITGFQERAADRS